jgi:hypothetical protein
MQERADRQVRRVGQIIRHGCSRGDRRGSGWARLPASVAMAAQGVQSADQNS